MKGLRILSAQKDFFSKCEQIRRKLRIWSDLLKKSLMENFSFCAVTEVSGSELIGRNVGIIISHAVVTAFYLW